MGTALEKHQDTGLLIARLGFGLGFFWFHGWPKLIGGPDRWTGVGGAMENFGIGFGHTYFGFAAALTESVGGLLFAAGLFYRPVSLLLAAVMLTAATQHIVSGQGTPAHALKNFFLFSGMTFTGPGKYSLDAKLRRKG